MEEYILEKRKIVICITAVGILMIIGAAFLRTDNFTGITGVTADKIDKITVQADWGENTTITSKNGINAIINHLDTYKYRRNIFSPSYSGYLYWMSFYRGDKKIATFVISGNVEINNQKYEVIGKMHISKIERIVGLYPPSGNNG
jgi:hypothetical protein